MDRWDRQQARLAQLFFGGALLVALPAVLIPLGLSSEADASDYRVPMLQWMLRHRALPDWPWTPVDNYPMLGELLMLPLRALRGGLDRLVPIAAYAGIGLAAGALLRRVAPALGAAGFWLAAALAVAFRPVALQANLLMVDNVASAFVLLALVLLLARREALAGFAFGLAMATRYSVWPLLPALWLASWVHARDGRALLRLTIAALVPVVPHLVRNALLEGNPVFPLLTSVLGPTDVVVNIGWDRYGRDNAFVGLLLLPFDLLFTSEMGRYLFDYTVGRSTLLLLALGGVCVLTRREPTREAIATLRENREARALLAFAASGMCIWCFTGPQLRFAVPELVVLLVLFLAVFLHVASRPMIVAMLAAGALTLAAVHKDTLLMVAGKKESPYQAAADAARVAIERAHLPPGAVIGWTERDHSLGFLDRDFAFVGAHPYALGPAREAKVDWVYDPRTPALPAKR